MRSGMFTEYKLVDLFFVGTNGTKNLAREVRMHSLGLDETKSAAMGDSKDFGIVWMSIVRQLTKVLADGPNPSMKILH